MCIYIYIYTYTHSYTYIYIYIYTHVYIYIYIYYCEGHPNGHDRSKGTNNKTITRINKQ